jgi:hypothetical protein
MKEYHSSTFSDLFWRFLRSLPDVPSQVIAQMVVSAALVLLYFCLFPRVLADLFSREPALPDVVTSVQSWGELSFNAAVSQVPLTVRGRRFWRGLGTHADSTIELRVPAGSSEFRGACALDDEAKEIGEFTCAVRRDGQIVWETPVVNHKDPIHFFRISLTPGARIELLVRATSRGINFAHADWIDLRFEQAGSSP